MNHPYRCHHIHRTLWLKFKNGENDRENFFRIFVSTRWNPIPLIFAYTYLDEERPHHWIERAGDSDLPLITWPERRSKLLSCDFFSWGWCKITVYEPVMHRIIRGRICEVLGYNANMIKFVKQTWLQIGCNKSHTWNTCNWKTYIFV